MTLNFSSVSFQNQDNMGDPVKFDIYVDVPCLPWTTIAAGFIYSSFLVLGNNLPSPSNNS